MISDPVPNVFTDTVTSSFCSGVFPDSEKKKHAVVMPFLKAGKERDELSSYRPLYNT